MKSFAFVACLLLSAAALAQPASAAAAAAQGFDLGELQAMRAELARQAAEINELRALVQRMAGELGLTPLWGDVHNHCDLSYGHGRFEDALARAA